MTVLSISAACRTNRNHMTLCRVQSFPWICTACVEFSPTQALTTLSTANVCMCEVHMSTHMSVCAMVYVVL